MALGDEKHKLIYDELVNTLGQGNVSHDPAVMQTYSRDYYSVGAASFICSLRLSSQTADFTSRSRRYLR